MFDCMAVQDHWTIFVYMDAFDTFVNNWNWEIVLHFYYFNKKNKNFTGQTYIFFGFIFTEFRRFTLPLHVDLHFFNIVQL